MRGVPIFADEFNEVGIQHKPLGHFDRPRFSVSLRIIDRNFDFQISVINSAEFLGHLGGIGQWRSLDVKPYPVPEACRFDNQIQGRSKNL